MTRGRTRRERKKRSEAPHINPEGFHTEDAFYSVAENYLIHATLMRHSNLGPRILFQIEPGRQADQETKI